MLCKSNKVLPCLQMGVAGMKFVKDLCYGLPNLETSIFCPNVTVHVQTEFDFFCCKGEVYAYNCIQKKPHTHYISPM